MIILAVMGVILVLFIIIGIFIIFKVLNSANYEGELEGIKEEEKEVGSFNARDYIPVKKIHGPIAELEDEEYMLIIETGALNFFLKSEDGFDRLDEAFSELCLALEEDEEMIGYVANEFLDEKAYFEECRRSNKKNKEYSVRRLMASTLDFFERRTRGQLVRRNFIILGYQHNKFAEQTKDFKIEESVTDLAAEYLLDKASMYLDILESKLGISARVVVGADLLEVIYKHLNKNLSQQLSIKELIEQESTSIYVTQLNEKIAHLKKNEQVEMVALDYQTDNTYIVNLQEEFERRLNSTIDEEIKFYQGKVNRQTIQTEEGKGERIESEEIEDNGSSDGFMTDEEFINGLTEEAI